ncbi:MAG: lactate racemase domain-containing protein, partial [Bacteroidota bacterium]
MNVRLKFGQQGVKLDLSDRHAISILRTPGKHVTTTDAAVIDQALQAPVDSPTLEDFFRPQDRVAVIVPDKTRKCKVHAILPILLKKLETRGVRRENILILFANGAHSRQTEAQKISILGEKVYRRYTNEENNARDEFVFTPLGTTERGTPVTIHQAYQCRQSARRFR